MTGRTFKKRYTEHRSAIMNRKTAERNPTKLSKHVWSLKDRNIQPEVQWKVRAKTGENISKKAEKSMQLDST